MKPTNNDYLTNFIKFAKNNQKPVVRCFFATFISFCLSLIFSKKILIHLEKMCPIDTTFIQNSPTELFFLIIKITILSTIILSLPTILYQTIKYKTQGVIDDISLKWYRSLIGAILLFIFSVVIALKIIIPGLLFLFSAITSGVSQMDLNITKYISFCLSIIFSTTLVIFAPYLAYIFENTVIKELALKYKKPVIWGLFSTAAFIILPEDIISLFILTAFIIFSYFIIIKNVSKSNEA